MTRTALTREVSRGSPPQSETPVPTAASLHLCMSDAPGPSTSICVPEKEPVAIILSISHSLHHTIRIPTHRREEEVHIPTHPPSLWT